MFPSLSAKATPLSATLSRTLCLRRAASSWTAPALRRTSASQQQQQQQQQSSSDGQSTKPNENWKDGWFWGRLALAAAGGITATTIAKKWTDERVHADVLESAVPVVMQASQHQQHPSKLSKFTFNKATGQYPKWYEVGVTNSRTRIKPTTTPEHYEHVIIGAGQAARACLETLNNQIGLLGKAFSRHKILMVAEERNTRINAVVTSKEDIDELQRLSTPPNTTVIFGPSVDKLDIHSKLIQLSDGRVFSYNKLFIGTGGVHPEGLPCTDRACSRVFNLRTLNDLQRLDKIIESGQVHNIAVVGGGTFGVEATLDIFMRNRDRGSFNITQVYAEPGVMYKMLPEYFRAYITARLRGLGIAQKNFSLVSKVDVMPNNPDQVYVELDSWERTYLPVDLVVFAPTTVCANTDLAAEAGLEIDDYNGGLVVNRELSAATDVFAGGDVVSYPNVVLGRRRDQIYDHAIASGVIAAHNMLGEHWPYYHLPAQTVDLRVLGLHIEMVGVVDARCETVAFWDMGTRQRNDNVEGVGKYDRGVVYYLNNGFIVGVMLVNIEGTDSNMPPIEAARQVLYDQIDYTGVETLELELRDLIPHKPFASTLVKHVNWRSVVRDLVHGRQASNMGKNPFKVRRTLLVDKQFLPEDVLRVRGNPTRAVVNNPPDIIAPSPAKPPSVV